MDTSMWFYLRGMIYLYGRDRFGNDRLTSKIIHTMDSPIESIDT